MPPERPWWRRGDGATLGRWMAAAKPTPRSARRALRVAVAAVVLVALVVVALAAAVTRLETYGASAASGAPAWAGPCYAHEPRPDRELLERCARATGVVAHVRARGDGGWREVHFALVGRFGAVIVKLGDPDVLETPDVGTRVTVVGPLVRASNGMREIQAWLVG